MSYVPTFQYGYQCSASLLQAYGPVFLLMALFSCLGEPIVLALVRLLVDKGGPRFSRLHWLLPRALLSPEERTHLEKRDYRVFDAHKLFMAALQDLLVILTFGIAAPLLGLAVTVSLFLKTLLWHHVLTHCSSGSSSQAAEDVEADCAEFVSRPHPLFTARWFLVGFSSFFLSFFLIDAAGDAVGWRKAMWAPVLMWTLPTLLSLALGRFFSARAPSSEPTEAAATVEFPALGKRASVSLEGIYGGKEGGDKEEEDQRYTMSEVLERESGGHADHIPASLRLSGVTASPLHTPNPTTSRLPV